MNRQCVQCHKTFQINKEDLEFYDRVSPIIGGKKFLIPPPTHCPDCRLQRRLAVRNERNLYARKCDLCRKNIVSQYPANVGFLVYCSECWWSDKWDPAKYGRGFDFNKPFFSQFNDLLKVVPKVCLMNQNVTLFNSDYVNYTADAKNCYLVFATNWLENCLYSSYIWECKDTVDCSFSTKLELCYDCMDCDRLYDCQFLQQSQNCHECIFGYGLKGCSNCFGCINLTNKQYYFFNKQLSSKDYQQKIEQILSSDQEFNKAKQQYQNFSLKYPRKYSYQLHCENSTGEGIKNCKNCQYCFDGYGGENLKWMMNFPGEVRDCYDISGCSHIELCYEIHALLPGYHALFSNFNLNGGRDIIYCAYGDNCRDSFGCVGMKKAQYAIFNKEYSKEEYEKLVARIIDHMQKTGEWGEFFPISISPFPYNETVAAEYFPLKKEEVQARGWQWSASAKATADKRDLPVCQTCGRNFNIIQQEKEFYQKQKIFLPHRCPDCRNQERIAVRNARSLWHRQCMCTQPSHGHHGRCGQEFETTYSPERKELVYCEQCYNKEIY